MYCFQRDWYSHCFCSALIVGLLYPTFHHRPPHAPLPKTSIFMLSRIQKDRNFKTEICLFVEMHFSVCLETNQKQCFGKLHFTTCDGKRPDYCVQNIRYVKSTKVITNTVEPLFSGHSRGRDNWPLNRGSPKNNTRRGPVFSLLNNYKHKQMQWEKK